MTLLRRTGWRHLLRHRWQSVTAILGITLGVAVVMAVELANQSARRALALSLEQIEGRTSHRILAVDGSLDEGLYHRLRTIDGVRSSAPVVSGKVRLREETFTLLGLDPLAERPLRTLLPALGSDQVRALLIEPDGLILPHATAKRLGIERGDRIELLVAGAEVPGQIVGLTGAADDYTLDGLLLADIAAAQRLLGMAGRLSRIDLRLDDAQARDLARSLPAGTQLVRTTGGDSATAGMSDAFQTNLSAMSLLALLVGGFLIYNAMTFSVLQRRTQFGIQRLLGVTRGELFRQILVEALLIGALGTACGMLLGYLLGQGLVTLVARTIDDLFFSLRVAGLTLQPGDLVKGAALGILATLAAATPPALEAARTAPVSVNRRSELEARAHRLAPWLAVTGSATALAGGGLLTLPGGGLVAGFVALFLLIIGYSLCVPGAVLFIVESLQPLAARWSGISTRLALRGITASLSRTGLAVAALTLAVATTLAMGTMISSFRTTVSDWLEQTLQGEIYLSLSTTGEETRRAQTAARLAARLPELPGVHEISMGRSRELQLPSGRVRLLALHGSGSSHRGFRFKGATLPRLWQGFRDGELVLVSEPYAYRQQLQPGDPLELPTSDGPRRFRVGGVFFDYGTGPGLVVLPLAHYRQHWRDETLSTLGIFLEPGYPLPQALGEVRRLAAQFDAGASVTANAEIRTRTLALFDRTFTITEVLRLLVVLIAFVGIFSAFMAMQLERAREYAILRATGLTQGELRRLVLLQTALLGALAGVLALPLGWMMGTTLIEVINTRAFGWTLQSLFPPRLTLEALALALTAALLAGLYPALRLSRSAPAAAMREE